LNLKKWGSLRIVESCPESTAFAARVKEVHAIAGRPRSTASPMMKKAGACGMGVKHLPFPEG